MKPITCSRNAGERSDGCAGIQHERQNEVYLRLERNEIDVLTLPSHLFVIREHHYRRYVDHFSNHDITEAA